MTNTLDTVEVFQEYSCGKKDGISTEVFKHTKDDVKK
jgi:hypothetical protein